MKGQNMGIIDLGSNSIRFVIYKFTKTGKYKEELNMKITARLSLHVDKNKNITPKGLKIIMKTLKDFKRIAKFYQVKDIQCVATAVIREAPNQRDLIKEIKKNTKISVEVLAGSEEAYYGYLAVVNSIDIKNGITIDIGGGSTEITLFENRQLKSAHSFPFGAVTLTKAYIKGKKPTKKELKRLRRHVYEQFSKLPWLIEASYPVIGIGGSARNLTRIYQREKEPTLSTIDQVEIRDKDIQSISTHLSSLSLSKRKKIKGLSKDRADIIIAGIEAIYQLMQVVQAPAFIMSEKGLREGICYANQAYRIERSK